MMQSFPWSQGKDLKYLVVSEFSKCFPELLGSLEITAIRRLKDLQRITTRAASQIDLKKHLQCPEEMKGLQKGRMFLASFPVKYNEWEFSGR